jgi:copper transport protein
MSLARACLAPFSVLAAVCVGLLAATGLYDAGRQVASIDALLTTLYGRALLGKVGLVLAVGVFGLLNMIALRPHLVDPLRRLLRLPAGWTPLPPTRMRSLLVVEAAFGVLLLAAVGLLTAAPPARGPAFAPAPEATPSFQSTSAEDLLVSLSVKPNRPGSNVFEARAVSTRRPAPGEIEQVKLRFTSSEGSVVSPPLEEVEPGRYRLGGDYLSSAGPWRIEALVERTGLQASQVGFDWTVASPVPPREVLVSDRPLEPLLLRAAGVLLLAFVLVAAAVLLVRRPPGSRRRGFGPGVAR